MNGTTALYIRVSTEAQRDEGYSIEAQQEMLVGFCKSRRIKDYEIYIDGGFSGSSIERPEIRRLIDDVKAGKISRVAVYKLDRLSRSQKDTLYLIEDVFNPNGVDFVSLNENMDTSTPIGRAMLGIMSAFAQLERETIRERTKMGMNERIKNGYWRGGGHVPFGYDYDSASGILVPNADAETVRRVFELYIGGSSTLRIARLLGLKYERMASQILRRKTYAGYILYGGEEYKGRHEPIISLETYENAARVMRGRAARSLAPARSLLAGLIVCGVCGSKMRYQKWGERGYKIYCYSQDSAKTHLARGGECENDKIWADEVETAVLSDFFRMARETVKRGNRGGKDVGELLTQRRAAVQRRLRNLYNLYSSSEDEALRSVIADAKSELAEIDAETENREKQRRRREQSEADANRLCEIEQLWEHMMLAEKQSILRDYIEKIVITHQNIDIFYRI